jgi:hypothetical protein
MSSSSDWSMVNAQHGMLVAFGEFLKQHGVIDRLMGVTIGQETRQFAPQTKLVEFLAGIMSGTEYLEDLNDGAHPLAQDRSVGRRELPAYGDTSSVAPRFPACSFLFQNGLVWDPAVEILPGQH